MRLPASVKIGPHRYRLEVDRNGVLEGAGSCSGATLGRRLLIVIDGQLEGTQRAEVLLHEVLHGCLASHGMDHDEEEAVVNAAAGPLLDALRSNPGLVRVLLA
jgi:hypothetical protein